MAYFTEVKRSILRSFSKFLSILLIVALGVGVFAGVKATGTDMKRTADQYSDDHDFMDLSILSTGGLTAQDVAAVAAIEGVAAAEGFYTSDALIQLEDKEAVMKFISLPKAVNRLTLTEGTLPVRSGECVLTVTSEGLYQFKIGDTVRIASENSGILSEYKIVGFVQSPCYISFDLGSSTQGSGKLNYVAYITEENFAQDYFSELAVTVSGAKVCNTYGSAYSALVEAVRLRIEGIAEERTAARLSELQAFGEQQIAALLSAAQQSGTKIDEAFIAQLRNQLDLLKQPQWYVLDRSANIGYVSYQGDSEKVDAIAAIFPVFFFLVAALVCLTTMTRMVEEERTQIGVMKALGYGKGAIAAKYLIYAGLASTAGSLLGLAVGFQLFPKAIFAAYQILYRIPDIQTPYHLTYALVSSLSAILCTVLASLAACIATLRERPAALMLPKSPKAGKRILLERIGFLWKHMSFSQKVSARNLFRYKKRFWMTIVGIAGCTALLLTGFGLKNSISDIVDKQFRDIALYDMSGSFAQGAKIDDIAPVLEARGVTYLAYYQKFTDISSDDFQKQAYLFIPDCEEETIARFEALYSLHTRRTGTPQPLSRRGVVITEKLAKELHVSAGDTIQISDGTERVGFLVTGIAENYIYHYVYMLPETYEAAFGGRPAPNYFAGRLSEDSGTARDTLSEELLRSGKITAVNDISDFRVTFDDAIGSLNIVVLVLIVCAALLAFIVLYNLTNINITERQREVATIKVLGFYDPEVSSYIFRESVVLTVIGILFGLVLGVILHAFVVSTAEVDMVMFGREIKAMSYVISAVLTLVFSILVDFAMHFRLKNISMVDSLKSAE